MLVLPSMCAGLATDLCQAIQEGQAAAAGWLLQADGASVVNQICSGTGNTPLGAAAAAGRADLVKALLEAGAKPNAADGVGSRPLHNAALGGHAEVIRVLAAAGASVDLENSAGDSPLCVAAALGHVAAIQALLSHHASLGFIDRTGLSPLHFACFAGHTDAAAAMLEAGASPSAVDQDNDTPLHKLAQGWRPEADPLYAATAQALLKSGADPEAANAVGLTPLAVAAGRGARALAQDLEGAAELACMRAALAKAQQEQQKKKSAERNSCSQVVPLAVPGAAGPSPAAAGLVPAPAGLAPAPASAPSTGSGEGLGGEADVETMRAALGQLQEEQLKRSRERERSQHAWPQAPPTPVVAPGAGSTGRAKKNVAALAPETLFRKSDRWVLLCFSIDKESMAVGYWLRPKSSLLDMASSAVLPFHLLLAACVLGCKVLCQNA
jgi:ankyrin repeat protein